MKPAPSRKPLPTLIAATCALLTLVACPARADDGAAIPPPPPARFDPLAALDRVNVSWDSPSGDACGSMPIGNGEVGANVWVERNGDVVLLLSRTDAWSEAGRLLKVAQVRVRLIPTQLDGAVAFRQALLLRDGRILIEGGRPPALQQLEIFVEPDRPVIRVVGRCGDGIHVSATLENWRTERRRLVGPELESAWTMRDAPAPEKGGVEVWESADRFLPVAGEIACVHVNETSIVPFTLKHQGIEQAAGVARDPLLGRVTGALVRGDGMDVVSRDLIRSPGELRKIDLRIVVESRQPGVGGDPTVPWLEGARAIADAAPPGPVARDATAAWWNAFWTRSWIFVGGDGPAPGADIAAAINRSYALQRWIQGCGGRGTYPIKFNGSIFTVEPRCAGGPDFNSDWRKWGDCYWWQNTRLPYHPMLAAGDFDLMRPLFRLHRDVLPLCEARTKIWFDADGAYFPETMTIFGAYSNGDYGWDRAGCPANDPHAPWWKYAWNQGPELLCLMLDHVDHTGDERFRDDELVPMARSVLSYFDSRFKRDDSGKLEISPAQALETYVGNVVNDAPTVVGLRAALGRLRALPATAGSPDDRALWDRLWAALPPVPTLERDGVRMLAPAGRFDPQRSNYETPELYAVFPYRLYGVGRPDLDHALAAYRARVDRGTNGWTQDGQFAALLGQTDDAKPNLLAKIRNSNKGFRFPAMWGPNFDWTPDQDHGSNLMTTLQLMLLQHVDDEIILLPAWPREWDVNFKLHAPRQTTVECEYRGGAVRTLSVTPADRAKNARTSSP